MILFTIKKTFFDMWDNLFSIIFLNIGFSLITAVGIYILQLFTKLDLAFLFLGILVVAGIFLVYIGAASMLARDIADYKAPTFKTFFQYIKEVWKASLAFTLTIVIQLFIILGVYLYSRIGNILSFLAISILFWTSVVWWLSSQYYFPVRSRLDTKVKKIFFKSFALFFDNTLFTIALAIGTLILLILSSFTAFLIPGIGTILLWHQVGTKLRCYKYDYLEQHPDAGKKNIPWTQLLDEERERVGKRTLRGLIFPWKE